MQQIADRAGSGAVVKDSGAPADHGLALRRRRVGEADAGSEVVWNIVKVVLPVVAQTQIKREIWFQANIVLDKSGDHLFQKSHVSLAGLHQVVSGRRGGIGRGAGET